MGARSSLLQGPVATPLRRGQTSLMFRTGGPTGVKKERSKHKEGSAPDHRTERDPHSAKHSEQKKAKAPPATARKGKHWEDIVSTSWNGFEVIKKMFLRCDWTPTC